MAPNTIVAATDFSTQATHAAQRAAMLANETGAQRAVLVHVLRGRWLGRGAPWLATFAESSDARRRGARLRLRRLADRVRRPLGVQIETDVREGALVDSLARAAASADLLVIGGHGAHPIRDLVLASTAQRLLRHSATPLLVVKREPRGPYRRVLVAVDLPAGASGAVSVARTLAPAARYDFVHAYRAPFEGRMRYAGVPEDSIDAYRQEALQAAVLQMSEAVLSRLTFPRLTAHIVHGDAAMRVVDKQRELGADLLVVSRVDKPLAEQLVFPSVTLRLLERAEADVLVVRERGTSDLTR